MNIYKGEYIMTHHETGLCASHVGLYHLLDGFPAHGTGVGTGSQRFLASLTDGEVTTRQHQNTFLIKQQTVSSG